MDARLNAQPVRAHRSARASTPCRPSSPSTWETSDVGVSDEIARVVDEIQFVDEMPDPVPEAPDRVPAAPQAAAADVSSVSEPYSRRARRVDTPSPPLPAY